jgi:hypothetical protein
MSGDGYFKFETEGIMVKNVFFEHKI